MDANEGRRGDLSVSAGAVLNGEVARIGPASSGPLSMGGSWLFAWMEWSSQVEDALVDADEGGRKGKDDRVGSWPRVSDRSISRSPLIPIRL
jgi:hypothetical protein